MAPSGVVSRCSGRPRGAQSRCSGRPGGAQVSRSVPQAAAGSHEGSGAAATPPISRNRYAWLWRRPEPITDTITCEIVVFVCTRHCTLLRQTGIPRRPLPLPSTWSEAGRAVRWYYQWLFASRKQSCFRGVVSESTQNTVMCHRKK